jgi:hypothetical protein
VAQLSRVDGVGEPEAIGPADVIADDDGAWSAKLQEVGPVDHLGPANAFK